MQAIDGELPDDAAAGVLDALRAAGVALGLGASLPIESPVLDGGAQGALKVAGGLVHLCVFCRSERRARRSRGPHGEPH
jgi:hypothetical protein